LLLLDFIFYHLSKDSSLKMLCMNDGRLFRRNSISCCVGCVNEGQRPFFLISRILLF
jgi:hypothetical protein